MPSLTLICLAQICSSHTPESVKCVLSESVLVSGSGLNGGRTGVGQDLPDFLLLPVQNSHIASHISSFLAGIRDYKFGEVINDVIRIK